MHTYPACPLAQLCAILNDLLPVLLTMTLAFPQYNANERFADFCIHILGVAGSLVGALMLLILAAYSVDPVSALSLSIYAVGMTSVFVCSAAYNLVTDTVLKGFLRRCDHAAIYLKIAATYTPFAAVKIGGWSGSGLLALVWLVAIFGLIIKLFHPERLIRTSYALYLAQGWAVLLFANPLIQSVSAQTVALLTVGGVLYTVGMIFHLWTTLRFHNAIWHGFVVCGSGCHFVAILDAVALS